MSLASGTRLGPYAIVSPLGAGGMGEVYRATDTRLDRTVALKVLPAEVAADPQFRARFDREARAISQLQHPHICTLFDVGDDNGIAYLVMELLDGQTLSARIRKGVLPLDEALRIAVDVADALAAAHKRGIVHRDLKPGNIMLTKAGAKLLDFGLAKGSGGAGGAGKPGGSGRADGLRPGSPDPHDEATTMTSPERLTGVGTILGTLHYMAPEQVEGREVDTRTDIWAFGALLYEMLTGQLAFTGDSSAAIAGAILKDRPLPLSAKRPEVSPLLDHLVARCLEKDPDERWQSASDIARQLAWASYTNTGVRSRPGVDATHDQKRGGSVPPGQARGPRRLRLMAAAVFGVAIGAGAMGLAAWRSQPTSAVVQERRLQIAPTGAAAVALSGLDSDLAITPDGSRVVYIGDRGNQLFVRQLGAVEPKSVATGELRAPFVSPDGRWVGYLDGGQTIKRVPIDGGPATTVLNVIGGLRGAAWTPGGTIVFAGLDATGLQEVSADGGSPTLLTTPDRTHGEQNHWWPEALPDGQHLLFTIIPANGRLEAAQIALLDRRTKQWKVLIRGGAHAQFDPRGYLLYGAAGAIRAVRFDLARGEISEPTVTVAPQVDFTSLGGVNFAVAHDGTLVFVPGGAGSAQRTLAWADRNGQRTSLGVPPRTYIYPRVSPDGRRVLTSSQDEDYDLWVWDIAKSSLSRLTFEPGQDSFPAWFPDGNSVAFVSTRTGSQSLFWQPADGRGRAEPMATSIGGNISSVTADGKWVLFAKNTPSTGFDILKVGTSGEHAIETVIQTAANERNAEVSPNGRWLAYQSDEAGRYEIYVRPFPSVDGGRWQVSYSGGTRPLWGPDGRELFYLAGDTLMRVEVDSGANWTAGSAQELFRMRVPSASFAGRSYDITPDGRRFVVVDAATEAGSGTTPVGIVLVEHWETAFATLPSTR